MELILNVNYITHKLISFGQIISIKIMLTRLEHIMSQNKFFQIIYNFQS